MYEMVRRQRGFHGCCGLGKLETKGKVVTPTAADATQTAATKQTLLDAAAAEQEALPIEEVPTEREGVRLDRYMPQITIASTAIGLATFIGWLLLRK